VEHARALKLAEAECSGLAAEMAGAAAAEDYARAAELREAVRALEGRDALARVREELAGAVEREDFGAAAALRDASGGPLEGWWVGKGLEGDPVGHLLHVEAGFGRWVGTACTARDLAAQQSLEPPPLKGAAGTVRSLEEAVASPDELLDLPPPGGWEVGPARVMEVLVRDQPPGGARAPPGAGAGPAGGLELQAVTLHPDSTALVSGLGAEPEDPAFAVASDNLIDSMMGAPMELEAAALEWSPGSGGGGRDEFVLTTRSCDERDAQMMQDVSQQVVFSDKAGGDVAWPTRSIPDNVAESIRDLVSTSQEMHPQLAGATRYQRLDLDLPSTDPFTGYFVGNFGKHGPELLRLRREWQRLSADGDGLDAEAPLEEVVVAEKVTGDRNVPAGTVSFRARVGRQHRLDSSMYPDDLMITGRYKGEGRVAKADYQEPKWVEGDLLVFNKRADPLMMGAELGFVWSVPGRRRYLILLNRVDLASLKLDDGAPPPAGPA